MESYYTIEREGEAKYTEKMSRFLAFALRVKTADEARARVKEFQNSYHDARHVCWAYMLGAERTEWQLNDNGEPSGTAGKPILGQINSRELTDVLVIVVRYFGGIKLGTPGLIAAFREAASEALDDAGRRECYLMGRSAIETDYAEADKVMRILKASDVEIIEKQFDNVVRITIEYRIGLEEELTGRIESTGAKVKKIGVLS